MENISCGHDREMPRSVLVGSAPDLVHEADTILIKGQNG